MPKYLYILITLLPALANAQLETLRKPHPRLILPDSELPRIHHLILTNPQAKALYLKLVAEAATIEKQPAIEHVLIGPRLLDKSRRAVDRIYILALLYRLDRNPQYLNRAVKELRAAAAFPDWNPSHFLDTAEMTHAFAIGYDWLYNDLQPEDRAIIKKAIVELGVNQSLEIYKAQRWWTIVTHNWNQVCNAGMSLGALAIADEEPALSAKILNYALASIPRAIKSYGPDGGWNEGPGYWAYATRYSVYMLAALDTALGKDFGLSDIEGFSRAGHFRVYSSGTAGKTFNYADAGSGIEETPGMFWLARRFKQPVYAWHQLRLLEKANHPQALNLAWYPTESQSAQAANWPPDAFFNGQQHSAAEGGLTAPSQAKRVDGAVRPPAPAPENHGVDVAFLRSTWDDPNATWFAIKGGDNRANHSHLDLGSFVLDSQGVRWASDLGGDDYNLPTYFGAKRFEYYRLRTESHNTVLVDNENQDPRAKAPIVNYQHTSLKIDMTAAYPKKFKSYYRTASLKGDVVTIEDTAQANNPVDFLWGMVTEADVTVNGRKAELTKNGKKLTATIESPANAVFEVISTTPPKPQNQNAGTHKLAVRLPGKVTDVTLRVRLQDLH